LATVRISTSPLLRYKLKKGKSRSTFLEICRPGFNILGQSLCIRRILSAGGGEHAKVLTKNILRHEIDKDDGDEEDDRGLVKKIEREEKARR
jgi:hypothetical protein